MSPQRLVVRRRERPSNRALTKFRIAGWLRKLSVSGNRPAGGHAVAQLAKHVRIGPAKAIDRLLVVADEEQLAALPAPSPHRASIKSTCSGSVS